MSMKVVNEMALSASKPITVMLLEPYAGKLARTVLTGKVAGSWFGACVFLIVAATVLRAFFL